MITGRQIREARLMLDRTGDEFCTRANVAADLLTSAEGADGTPSIQLYLAAHIQQAFERAGVRFGRNCAVMRMTSEEDL